MYRWITIITLSLLLLLSCIGVIIGYQDGYAMGYINGNNNGNITGSKSGYTIGFNNGDKEGYTKGYNQATKDHQNDGYADGYNQGYALGQQNQLDQIYGYEFNSGCIRTSSGFIYFKLYRDYDGSYKYTCIVSMN